MGQSWVHLEPKPVIDWDTVSAEVAVDNNAVNTVICTLNCKMGKAPFLVSAKQAWEADMDTFVSWSVFVNGVQHVKFPFSTVQLSPPETDYKLPVRVALQQGDRVELMANLAAGGTDGNFTGVLQIEYEDF